MKRSRIIAIAVAVTLGTFGVAAPAAAAPPAKAGVTAQAAAAGWKRIGWYPTAIACIRAATAYDIATCTPEGGGYVLNAYLNG